MCKKWFWLVVLSLAMSLAVDLPCGQAEEPNAPVCVKATSPSPADGATDVLRDGTVLKWTGAGADEYDVYLGTSAAAVAQADQATTDGTAVSIGQKATTFNPGRLALGQTYFWRVDQVKLSATDPNAAEICKGDLWSFSVEPVALVVTNIKATSSCSIYENMGPEKTIDGSGLVGDNHSASMEDMWLSCMPQPDPNDPNATTWIQYEFDNEYKLYDMWVWNWNSAADKWFGLGVKDVTILYSSNGTDWTTLGDVQFARAPGKPDYAPNTIVDLGVVAKYVKIVIKSSYRGLNEYGLSEVRFSYIPVRAREPNPGPGTKGVPLNPALSWRSGREAASHKVYLGTDKQAVIKGTAPVYTAKTNSLKLGSLALDLDKTYYWKVAEVNEAETPASWDSPIWNFRTIDYFVVEDFERYTNDLNNTWKSDYSAGTSTIEKSVVYGGKQSMLLSYDLTKSPYRAVAGRGAPSMKDWTTKGVKKLVVFFHGDPSNRIDPLFVTVNGARAVYSGSTKYPWWGYWSVDLPSLGVILTDVASLAVGVDAYDLAKGKVYIDEMRLYLKTPSIVTIVDRMIKLNSEGATKGQFDTLLAGVAAGDPKLLSTLSSEAQYTVFAPTDDAFAAIDLDPAKIVKLDKAVLNDLLRYSITAGTVSAQNVGNVTTLEGGFLVQDANVVTDDIGGQAVIKATAEASNGLIHTVDAVLLPFNMGKIVDLLRSLNAAGDYAGQFDTVLAGIGAAKSAVRDALGKRFTTMFVPTDDAFAALGLDPNTIVKVNQSVVSDILLYHTVSGRLMGDDLLAVGEIKTLQGGVLTQKDGELTDAIGGKARIIGLDVEASNGVLHIINAVAMPFATTRLYDVVTLIGGLNAGGDLAGKFDMLIKAAETADPSVLVTVSGAGPFTVFAPTDEAFAALGWDAAKIAGLDKAFLTDVLKYHIASGNLLKSAIQTAGQIKTLQGGALVADPNTAALTDLLGGQAKIVVPDILAANGVVQVIDAVLLPYAEPKPAAVDPNAPPVVPTP